jgi:hypothetical protein
MTTATSSQHGPRKESEHKRVKSSVLKSIITTKGHKRFLSDGSPLMKLNSSEAQNGSSKQYALQATVSANGPQASSNVLGEVPYNQRANVLSPRKTRSGRDEARQRTLCSTDQKDRTEPNGYGNHDPFTPGENLRRPSPKKMKSSTSLKGLFAKAKLAIAVDEERPTRRVKDKENTTVGAQVV